MDEPTSSTEAPNGTTPDLRIGSYRILQPLGTGGMSSVFRAVHVATNHEVALKVLTRTLARNATLLQRFLREARSAEALEHPNIVSIYDRGIDQGRHYLVLEYVPGSDFHDYIQRNGPLSVVEAASVVRRVADGLKYAAGRGLIHRDIKPSNILRTLTGEIKIIDLGLALQNEFEDERVTRDGTTVGTVDYMAPEQARDSRATSVRSDLYSLGCTFYYLLAGVPPYPGGDITDKLTRHAKSPAPDIRDLRPDIPAGITSIIQRMMAKKPEDRFASYDDLIAALDSVPFEEMEKASASGSIPLADTRNDDRPAPPYNLWPGRERGEFGSNGSEEVELRVVSLAELVADEPPGELRVRPPARPVSLEPPPPRQSLIHAEEIETRATGLDANQPVLPAKAASSASAWIISGAFVGVAFMILAIGLLQFMGSIGQNEDAGVRTDRDVDAALASPVANSPRTSPADMTTARRPSQLGERRSPAGVSSTRIEPEMKWVEPADEQPASIEARGAPFDSVGGSNLIPEWARSPVPDRIAGPFVAVRRVADSKDHPAAVSMLHTALDRFIGGTVELADEGPFFIDDLRVAGVTRLIRARTGYRSIVKIERSTLDAVRRQPAVFVLDRKDLTLDAIDLIVNVRDLSPTQTALFSCTGASLTLRNCSITILNSPGSAAFTVFRAESSGSHPTHIRLEQSLVRGWFTDGFALAGGGAELVLRKSAVLGGSGPLVRITDAGEASERRLVFVESLLAGPGPIINRTKTPTSVQTKALTIRAYGSVLGRLHGVGIASVISSSDSAEGAGRQIDWAGDHNLFAGWKGFFASGNDHMVTVADLAAVRSTWNGTDRESQEILSPWPYPPDLASATPVALSPFLPNREAILRQVAQPRAGLFEKAIAAYPAPAIPEPAGWVFEHAAQSGAVPLDRALLPPHLRKMGGGGTVARGAPAPTAPPAGTDNLELTFNTETRPWEGDLGAFLRDRLTPGVTHARVRVVGSGRHHFSPVRLARGLWLEIRVEPYSVAEPPSWSSQPQATGAALIELQGGVLVLANMILRHEQTSRLDHLIHVEDGSLVLSRCQLISPASAGEFAGDLIEFRSVSTQPRPSDPFRRLFSEPVDRPVCRLVDSLLITGGTALRAELGRGLIALSQCAVAAGGAAIELVPSKVARHRFEADLFLDHCTMTSERSIIRIGPWPGRAPGPDRPWLITSRNCAFLATYDRPTRETVLLRADADALACGTVFWQAADDYADADYFVTAGEGLPPPYRSRDVQQQWVHFWGHTHMRRLDGPRGSGGAPSVRFREKLRPGRVEPVNLVLEPGRGQLTVGADLGRQGITLPPARYGRARN
ncbi:MAG: serine/threonine-protein kinase [Isosphaerales bacterium]